MYLICCRAHTPNYYVVRRAKYLRDAPNSLQALGLFRSLDIGNRTLLTPAQFIQLRSRSRIEQRGSGNFQIVETAAFVYVGRVNRLTKHEQLVLCIMVFLLLLGWTVKAYRTAHPAKQAVEQPKP